MGMWSKVKSQILSLRKAGSKMILDLSFKPVPDIATTFRLVMATLFNEEGGKADRPLSEDLGGPTNLGVTQPALDRAQEDGVVGEGWTINTLTREPALSIYYYHFWQRAYCHLLPPAVSLLVFDSAVNQGPGAAVQLLQKALRVVPDGKVGPATLRAISSTHPFLIIRHLSGARLEKYRHSPVVEANFEGWAGRVVAVAVEAEIRRRTGDWTTPNILPKN